MNNNIYFPLESNVSFFETQKNTLPLVDKIKQSILMYDTLNFDDHLYNLGVSDRGSMDGILPLEISGKRRLPPKKPFSNLIVTARNEQTGKTFNLIPPSTNTHSYQVSFRPIIEELNIEKKDFIKFHSIKLNSKGENDAKNLSRIHKNCRDLIEGNSFFKDKVLLNFHKSLIKSNALKLPFMIDGIHEEFLKKANNELVKSFDKRLSVLNKINNLMNFTLPNFGKMEIDEILRFRKDRLFIKFRAKMLEINTKITENSNNLNEEDVDALFMKEMINEIKEISGNGKDLVINGLLGGVGLIPGAGTPATIASIAKGAKDLHKQNSSWLAFIIKNKI